MKEDYLYVYRQLFYYDFKYSFYPVRITNNNTALN